jgi:hypothetical protein
MPLAWHEVAEVEPADFTLATVPALFVAHGDRAAGIDDAAGSLEALLELSARHEAEGLGDAPWPPHYRKQEGEPSRVQPSRRRSAGAPARPSSPAWLADRPAGAATHVRASSGRRRSTKPLIEIARAARRDDALAGLERWKARHPEAAAHLEPADVLIDAMRGRSTTWTRIRVNLEHVPEGRRPAQEPLDPDHDPWAGWAPSEQADARPD